MLGHGGSRSFYVTDRVQMFAVTANTLLGSEIGDKVELVSLDSFGG